MRVNDRALTRDVSRHLQAHAVRIGEFVDIGEYHIHNQWFLTRYPAGSSLEPHVDGDIRHGKSRSCATILVYLNHEFDGGHTAFVDGYEDYSIKHVISPTTGGVLILKQDVLHMGTTVLNGAKYIIRGDVMCDDFSEATCQTSGAAICEIRSTTSLCCAHMDSRAAGDSTSSTKTSASLDSTSGSRAAPALK